MLMHHDRQFDPARALPAGLAAAHDDPPPPRFGLPAECVVETPEGWVEARRLRPGARVLTAGGVARLRAVELSHLGGARTGPLIRIGGGAFGNCAAAEVLPGQPVALESRLAQRRHGAAWVAMEARALLALPGVVERAGPGPVALVTLAFDGARTVFASGDLPLLCPAYADGPTALTAALPADPPMPILSLSQAQRLLRDRARILAAAGSPV